MSVIVWIVLGSIAGALGRTMVNHSLSLAAVLIVASSSWAIPSSAADAPDAWITTKAKMALLMAEDVSATAVRVDTTDGKVTLHGTVSSADEKARAERAARSVEGVAIEKRLSAREELSDAKIDVEVANGVARLTGTVRGQPDRLTALTLTRNTDGVRSVVGDLTVKAQ